MLGLPNLPDEDLLAGGKENNQPLRYFGEPKKFDFEPKNHVDLCTGLGLIDYERGTKLSRLRTFALTTAAFATNTRLFRLRTAAQKMTGTAGST
jgi:seryl-tRNA synthetase